MLPHLRSVHLVTVLFPVMLAGALASPASAALGHQLAPKQATSGLKIAGNLIPPRAASRAAFPNQDAGSCTTALCSFPLSVNPGLGAGKPFTCPAIQRATATITISNRFALNQLADVMRLSANGLPPNTDFDVFLVEHSPVDAGFAGFGFGWYQADLHSDGTGHASVVVAGIFDVETFIENPASPFTPIHTYNVGFWFNSPTQEQAKCGNATAPAAGPFNGEQNAGLLAMITSGGPLQQVHG
jgi:hypothetical protein